MVISSICIVYSTIGDTIIIDVHKGGKRCVGQNLDEEDEATFTLAISEEQNHNQHPKEAIVTSDAVYATVVDPDGTVLRGSTIKREKMIDFYMKINKRGVYEMCFEGKLIESTVFLLCIMIRMMMMWESFDKG